MRWRIFPIHSVVDGRCTCGKADCKSPGKHPLTKAGFKEATDDAAQIGKWWAKRPWANIGLATGSGLAVFDIDGPEGADELRALVAQHGRLPPTLTQATGRGFHVIFATRAGAGEVRSSAVGKIHVRGEGGYILLPPSDHISGKKYRWLNKLPLASLPDWLRQWSQGYKVTVLAQNSLILGTKPAYLQQQNQRDIGEKLNQSLKTQWSVSEQARLISALAAIPADNYQTWYQIGMALQQLGWEGNGTDIGFEIWDAWSATCREKYSVSGCADKWQAIARGGRGEITLGTIYHWARERGWNGGAPEPARASLGAAAAPMLNGHTNGHHALPAAFLAQTQGAIFFPDLTDDGKPRPTCTNAGVAVTALGIQCRKDLFHEKMVVGGEPINQWAGDMSDDAVQMIRKVIRHKYGFDPNEKNVRDACTQLCLENQFDPVVDYLDGLQWDGAPRLDTWLQRYMQAPDTELNRTIGRLVLIAAVRRARHPGTKFDQILVLESGEGKGKSTAIEILAGGRDYFSDSTILGKADREQQEAMCGVWLYEIADLSGMRKAEVEHVKAFASRTVDRARPAYGRYRVDRPRRTIFFATTNDDEYLKSENGNRRLWPVPVGRIDLQGLRRDRDQLWAEAAALEARHEPVDLPERLWKEAGEEQNQRLESDEWASRIHNYVEVKQAPDYGIMDVLVDNQFLQLLPSQVGQRERTRAGNILRRLGFTKFRKRLGGNVLEWRYRR
jgi:hypothetical protein